MPYEQHMEVMMSTGWTWVGAVICGLLLVFFPERIAAQSGTDLELVLAQFSHANATELCNHILNSQCELSSLPGGPHGFFEFVLFSPGPSGKDSQIHQFYDDDGTCCLMLNLDRGGMPKAIGVGGEVFAMNSDPLRWEHLDSTRWMFVVDSKHLSRFSSDPSLLVNADRGLIRLQPTSYARGILGTDAPRSIWDGATCTAIARGENGVAVYFRFRTPNDQRRFGTVLSEVAVTANYRLSFRGFIVNRESPLRLKIADPAGLAGRIGAIKSPGGSNGSVNLVAGQAIPIALRLRNEFPRLPCDDSRQRSSERFASRFQEKLVAHNLLAMKEIVPELESGRSSPDMAAWVADLVNELEVAYSAVDRALAQTTDDNLIDDANLFWLGFERAVDASTAMLVAECIVKGVIPSPHVPIWRKIRLCAALAELGPPGWGIYGLPPRGADSPFLDAVVAARWGRTPTKAQVDLCRARMCDENSGIAEVEAAIDSLIRWGRVSEIPREQFEVWFKSQLAATPTHRHCTWKALTRTPDGRQFLRERLDSLASTPEIQRDIAAMLCCRAEATLDMKRWDFMPEEECRETLQQCQPLAGAEVQKAKFTPAK